MNQKGEVLTIIAVTAAATLLVVSLIPNLDIFGKIFGGGSTPKAPTEEIWKEQTEEVIPRTGIVVSTGENLIAFEKRKTFRSGASKSPTKLTYGERIGQFFSGLTIWGIAALAFAFFVLGITPAMILARLKSRAQKAFENEKADKEKLKQALTNTVTAVQGIPEDIWKQVKPLFEASHDKQDRDLIKDLTKDLD